MSLKAFPFIFRLEEVGSLWKRDSELVSKMENAFRKS